ncbi:ricin-type beta-trefoil lectin domain protein [Streptomyces sp. KR80]|uniref:ricin-type beta-trefoil lectin domain protein n=1 Tax=Streptomyces sp. KR80 TaxID=3457426 RepID=UPI003FCFFF4F
MSELHQVDQSPAAEEGMHGDLSDVELTERIRAGAPTAQPATQELRRRHLPAVLAYARLCGKNQVAGNQLASQAFALAAQETCRGIEPRRPWRHHLLMLVQRVAVGWAAGSRRVRLEDDFAAWIDATTVATPPGGEPHGPSIEDTSAMLGGFHRLPERMRGVLWYGVVEGLPDAEVSAYLGIEPESVAELKDRALDAMRQAYLRTYMERGDKKCQGFRRIIEAASRPGDQRRSTDLAVHLAECPDCSRLLADLTRMADNPASVLADGLLPWGGAAYLAAGPVRGLPVIEPTRQEEGAAPTAVIPAVIGSTDASAGPSLGAPHGRRLGEALGGASPHRGARLPSRPVVLVSVFTAAAAGILAVLVAGAVGDSTPTGNSAQAPASEITVTTTATATATVSASPSRDATPSRKPSKKPPRDPAPERSATRPAPAPTRRPAPAVPIEYGSYTRVVNADSGLCLDIEGAVLEKRTDVITARCNGAGTQQWLMDSAGLLHSYADPDLCLDSRGSTDRGVGIWDCSSVYGENGRNLLFMIDRGVGVIRPQIAPDFALTPRFDGAGSELDLDPASGRTDQRWTAGSA